MAAGVIGLGLGPASAHGRQDAPGDSTSDCTPAPAGQPPVIHRQPSASLTANAQRVVLKAGTSTTVHLRLFQPAQEVDAFFLEDNGTKSEFTHCAFQGGLMWAATHLATDRNLQVGLGNFGDYSGYNDVPSSTDAFSASGTGGVSFLDPKVRKPEAAFFADVVGLGNAWSNGGSSVTGGDAAALDALYQAVTGAGQVVVPGDPDNIPAGQDARFHPDAFRVAVLIAGQWFNTPSRTPGYPGLEFAPVAAALRARGVNLAGVWLDNDNNKESNSGSRYDGLADLRRLVSDTGTRTASPLHCQSPGQTYRAGGLPLCVFMPPADNTSNPGGSGDPAQLGPTLRNLVDSMANPQPVVLRTLAGSSAITRITGARHARVDILLPHTYDVTVTVHCPVRLAGHRFPLKFTELVAGQRRADTALYVTCRPIPPVHHSLAPEPPAAVAVAAVGAAGQPPNPPTQPNPMPQAQPQPASQSALAAGTSEEPELSTEAATISGREPVDPTDLWFGTMAMTALAGASYRWRTRSQTSKASARVR